MKQIVEEVAYNYATEKTKFRKDVLKEVDADNYVLRHSDCIKDFIRGAAWQANQSPWISIEDRMPEDEQLVLTSSSIYGIKLLVWNDHYNAWDDEDGDDVYCERDKIDAWMPIPE